MQPTDIGPHPDAPDHYLRFGKPPEWDEQDCADLCVRRVAATGDVLYEPAVRVVRSELPSGDHYYPCFMSEWRPSPEELERLTKGEPIRMLISGTTLPPVSLWVREEGEI